MRCQAYPQENSLSFLGKSSPLPFLPALKTDLLTSVFLRKSSPLPFLPEHKTDLLTRTRTGKGPRGVQKHKATALDTYPHYYTPILQSTSMPEVLTTDTLAVETLRVQPSHARNGRNIHSTCFSRVFRQCVLKNIADSISIGLSGNSVRG